MKKHTQLVHKPGPTHIYWSQYHWFFWSPRWLYWPVCGIWTKKNMNPKCPKAFWPFSLLLENCLKISQKGFIAQSTLDCYKNAPSLKLKVLLWLQSFLFFGWKALKKTKNSISLLNHISRFLINILLWKIKFIYIFN